MTLLRSLGPAIMVLQLAGCGGSQKAPENAQPAAEATPSTEDKVADKEAEAAPESAPKAKEAEPEAAPSGPECKKDDECTIFADCCSCKAVPASKPSPVPCDAVCGESKCEVKGITIANVACDAGKCVIRKGK